MAPTAVESLGWAATAVLVSSYFCARPETLKRVQMVGAAMWTAYGITIGSVPVVAANLLVLAAAAWSGRRAVTTALSRATPHSLQSDRAPT
jgi:uncharacterized membrane protein YqjE